MAEEDTDPGADARVSVFQALHADDPAQLGDYVLAARLGAGGMGTVYLSHTLAGRPVAIKAIRPELADDPDFRRRFRHEVAAARRVHGLYTAPVIDSEIDTAPLWLATAFVQGPTLSAAISQRRTLPPSSVLLLAAGVAEALQAVHGEGIVHRDLKASNVLLATDGPRVIDFGIARAVDATALTNTGVGVAVGTPPFMSPEQALNHKNIGPATDIFSLGQLVTYAAKGTPAFGKGQPYGVLYRIVHEEPDLDDVPEVLLPLLHRCLAKDPDKRPSPAEVIDLCRAASRGGILRHTGNWLPEAITADITRHQDVPQQGATGHPLADKTRVPERTQAQYQGSQASSGSQGSPELNDDAADGTGTGTEAGTEAGAGADRAPDANTGADGSTSAPPPAPPAGHPDVDSASHAPTEASPPDPWKSAPPGPPENKAPEPSEPVSLMYRAASAPSVQHNAVSGRGSAGTTAAPKEITVTTTVTLTGHKGDANAVAFSPDGRTLATANVDKTATLWDVETRKPTATLTGHKGFIYAVAFSPDGKTLATGSVDKTALLWDVEARKPTAALAGHKRGVYAVAFSPDGKTLATASTDNTAILWSVETQEPTATLTAHNDFIYAVAFSPDGKTLATGSADNTAILWSVETQEPTAALAGHKSGVYAVAFSRDGKTVATVSKDGAVRLWNASGNARISAVHIEK